MPPLNRAKPTEAEATARLEEFCARAEHCTREVRDKLWLWGISGQLADRIVESLQDRRFIDDRRFAMAFVNDKVKFSRWGRRKIMQALSHKRIDREYIAAAIETIDEDVYEENLRHLLRAKAQSLPDDSGPQTREGRDKLFRFAVSRGYEPDMCIRFIRELFD